MSIEVESSYTNVKPKDESSKSETVDIIRLTKAVEGFAEKARTNKIDCHSNDLFQKTFMEIASKNIVNSAPSNEEKDTYKKDAMRGDEFEVRLKRALSAETGGNSIILQVSEKTGVDFMTLYILYVGEIANQNMNNPELLNQLTSQIAELFQRSRHYDYVQTEFGEDLPVKPPIRVTNEMIAARNKLQAKEEYPKYVKQATDFITACQAFAEDPKREVSEDIKNVFQ